MYTHYITYFTDRRRDGRQLSACSAWVTILDYSTEPTCPACKAWLDADADDLEALRCMDPLYVPGSATLSQNKGEQ